MEKTWSVVKFPDEDGSVEAIPTSWISGDQCYWPPYTKSKLQSSLEQGEHHNPATWAQHRIECFKNNVYDNYNVAKKKAGKALKTSDLDSQSDSQTFTFSQKRRKIFKKTYSCSSIEECEEITLPNPPILTRATPNNVNIPTCTEVFKENVTAAEVQIPASSITGRDLALLSEELPEESGNPIGVIDNPKNCSVRKTNIARDDETNRLLKVLIKKQNILQGMVSELMGEVAEIKERSLNQNGDHEITLSVFAKFELPIKTNEELQTFEEYLEDDTAFSEVVNEISCLGGRTIYEYIYRATEKLITNKVASEFSWLGRKGKKVFKDLELSKLLIKSALKVNTNATIRDVELAAQKWLKRCTERAKSKE